MNDLEKSLFAVLAFELLIFQPVVQSLNRRRYPAPPPSLSLNLYFEELTYSMQQDPSSEADASSATKEIRRTLLNEQLHYRVYKSPSLVPVFSHINPVHAPTLFIENTL
jgi:hypothetical protein